MAKPNYQHMKKQREAAKKREKAEKLLKRQAPRAGEGEAPVEPKETP